MTMTTAPAARDFIAEYTEATHAWLAAGLGTDEYDRAAARRTRVWAAADDAGQRFDSDKVDAQIFAARRAA